MSKSKRKIRSRVIVVLETMWGGKGKVPRFFRINPKNLSGSRLYRIIDHGDFWVTNVCPFYGKNANDHGKPDPGWLADNLERIDCKLLLVCGAVAKRAFSACGYGPSGCSTLFMPHPGARAYWTQEMIESWKRLVRERQTETLLNKE